MQENIEQRCTLKFYIKLEKPAEEGKDTLQQAYGDSLMNMPSFYHWYNGLQDGWESVVN